MTTERVSEVLQIVRSLEYLESTLSVPIRTIYVQCSWVACRDFSRGLADCNAVKRTTAIMVYSLKECMRASQNVESIPADVCLHDMQISAIFTRKGPDLYH